MTCVCGKRFPNDKERIDDGEFVYVPHRVGNHILICGRRSSYFPFQLFVGPDWPCMVVTYALIVTPTVFFIINVAADWGASVVVVSTITCLTTLCFFSATACSDPGIAFEDPYDLEKGSNLLECSRCNSRRPNSASHCYECGLCIDEIDHHCPWTGKCIAKKNLKTFHAFLWALTLHIVFVVLMVIVSAVQGNDVFTPTR